MRDSRSATAPLLDIAHAGRLTTPIGDMIAVVDSAGALAYLDFHDNTGPTPGPKPGDNHWRDVLVRWPELVDDPGLAHVAVELAAYFKGLRRNFSLPLAPAGNDFQLQVWAELIRIPYGETISYGELARRIGRPGAARAVGRANGSNPIAVIIPCHRVIGANGQLTGYSGGIERKRALLALEHATTPSGQATLGW